MGKALFPLIGFVEAKNQSLSGLEKMLEEQYRKGYLLDPKIKVTLVETADNVSPLSDELAIAKSRFKEVQLRYGEKHPKYIGAWQKLKELENRERE